MKAKTKSTGLKLYTYVLCVAATIIAALLLLAASTLLPQEPIDQHVLTSASSILNEGTYPKTHDHSKESQLDNFTDAVMIEEARGTTKTNLASILTNPRHKYEEASNQVEVLAIYAEEDADSPAGWYYARYWMGFRVYLRLLLVFFDYFQIRRYLSFLFFVLYIFVILNVTKNTNRNAAFFFALSIILVRPQTIVFSMQFSCCFFIAMSAMLLMPVIYHHQRFESLFFLELGMITQYFDFYTTPVLVFGYPIVYLYLLHICNSEKLSWKSIAKNALLWFFGYVLMWVAKLALTTWLTDVNGFDNGFSSMLMRIGINKNQDRLEAYDPLLALNKVINGLLDDRTGKIIGITAFGILFLITVILLIKKRLSLPALITNCPLLILSLLPLIWFCIAAEPTVIHYWFQYRSIALTYWAAAVWIYTAFEPKGSIKTNVV